MALSSIYRKLEKLREFAERDCGAETENAIRMIEKLMKENNITYFHYTPYTGQAERDAKKAREQEKQRKAYEESLWRRVSYTSIMKNILHAFLSRHYSGKFCFEGSSCRVNLTNSEYIQFQRRLNILKREWKRELKKVDDSLYDLIRSSNF
jgi:hypothetical protein